MPSTHALFAQAMRDERLAREQAIKTYETRRAAIESRNKHIARTVRERST